MERGEENVELGISSRGGARKLSAVAESDAHIMVIFGEFTITHLVLPVYRETPDDPLVSKPRC